MGNRCAGRSTAQFNRLRRFLSGAQGFGALTADRRTTPTTVAASFATVVFGTVDLLWLDIGDNGVSHTWPAQAIVIVCAAVLLRSGRCVAMAVIVIGIGQIVIALDAGTETPVSLGSVIVLYLFARNNSFVKAVGAAVFTATVASIAVFLAGPESPFVEAGLEFAQATFFAGIGIAARSAANKNERLIAVEATKLAQAERLRLAREVHDAIAHNLSSIAVQSGVASRLIDEDPVHAKAALDHINEAGRASLDELRAFLGLLRSDDSLLEGTHKPVTPDDIGLLVEEMSSGGLDVDLREHGEFPKSVDHTMLDTTYHILRESLINVARHAGPVQTTIELVHGETTLDLRVANEPGRTNRIAVPSTGVGILGMTERAALVGGTLGTAVASEGGFEVMASLPYQPPHSS